MKRTILFLCVASIISCNEKTNVKKTYVTSPPDTVRTMGWFIDVSTFNTAENKAKIDFIFRITRDTFLIDSVSPGKYEKRYRRDSIYYIPNYYDMKDSTGKVIEDSLGKPIKMVNFKLADKVLILHDYDRKFLF